MKLMPWLSLFVSLERQGNVDKIANIKVIKKVKRWKGKKIDWEAFITVTDKIDPEDWMHQDDCNWVHVNVHPAHKQK